jgi:hypothetical protein
MDGRSANRTGNDCKQGSIDRVKRLKVARDILTRKKLVRQQRRGGPPFFTLTSPLVGQARRASLAQPKCVTVWVLAQPAKLNLDFFFFHGLTDETFINNILL